MEQNINQAPVLTVVATKPFFKKVLTVLVILLVIVVLALAGIGWYVKKMSSRPLNAREISNMTRPALATPLTEQERKAMVKIPDNFIPLSTSERANLLKN